MTRSIRSYNVVALSIPIVYNKQGDYDPNGLMYALEANLPLLNNLKAHFLHQAHEHPPGLPPLKPGSEKQPHPLVRPLVLRACKGEIVRICFENQLNQPASIHLQSDGYDIQQSDGAAVGRNLNSTVAPGDRTVYEWEANHEGVFLFHDMANLSGGEDGTNLHGLFGALIVEPEGADWTSIWGCGVCGGCMMCWKQDNIRTDALVSIQMAPPFSHCSPFLIAHYLPSQQKIVLDFRCLFRAPIVRNRLIHPGIHSEQTSNPKSRIIYCPIAILVKALLKLDHVSLPIVDLISSFIKRMWCTTITVGTIRMDTSLF